MPTVADLGRLTKAKHPEYASMSDEEVGRRVKAKYPQYANFTDSTAATSAPPMMMTPDANPATQFLQMMKGRTLDALPAFGGMAGGLAAGIPGAAAGGALGEGVREAYSGKEMDPWAIAGQGALQGGLEGVGGLIAKGMAKAAPALMSRALGNLGPLSERFSTKAAQLTPEDIIRMHLEDNLTATNAGRAAAGATGDAARATRSAIFAGTGGTVSAKPLARKAISDAERMLGRRLTNAERSELISKMEDEANRILTERTHGVVPKANPGTPAQPASTILDEFGRPAIPAQPAIPGAPSRFTAREIEQIKEVAAKNARGAYKADLTANSVAADPVLSQQLADAARAKLRVVPGAAEQTAIIRRSIIEQQAIRGALKRGNSEWTPIHIGPVSLGMKLPRDKMSRLALILNNKRFQAYAKLSPRLAAESLHQLLYSADADATSGQ